MSNYAHPRSLVSASDLEALSSDSNVCIIDVREKSAYQESHVKNAIYINRLEFSSVQGVVYDMVADRLTIERLLSRFGITPQTRIVIYDDRGGVAASRLWWILKLYGHEDVAIVNGGWHSITLSSTPTVTTEKQYSSSDYHFPDTYDNSTYAHLHDVLASDPSSILDVRTPEERDGSVLHPGATAPGWIPGSNYQYYEEFLAPQEQGYTFLPYEQLKEKADALGLNPEKPCIVYCQAGFRAAHTFFVLQELLGFSKARVYDGSWIEYSATSLPKGVS
ncbi:MAG: sulfurtransferase [Brevinema sp.]